MKFLSVCSGIEAASCAWEPLGWSAAAFSEIEQFPSAVLRHHYPDTPNWGDMTRFKEWPDANIDLLVGGTPCQSFSIAGLRKGLADPRGNLALTFLAIAAKYTPRWIVWENVPGVLSSNGGRDFGSFLAGLGQCGYGWAYRVLDAQYFGVPQRRRRVFVVGHLGNWQRAAAVLFERHSLQGHSAPRRETGQSVAGTLESRASGGGGGPGAGTDGAAAGYLQPVEWPADIAPTLNAAFGSKMGLEDQYIRGGADCSSLPQVAMCLTRGSMQRMDAETETLIPTHGGGFDVTAFAHQQGGSIDMHMSEGCALSLQRSQTQAVAYPINTQIATRHKALGRGTGFGVGEHGDPAFTLLRDHHHAVGTASAVRRLTAVECERLQGFPDGYTAIPWRKKPAEDCPDGPRYKALGNSMAVPVMAWIGQRIAIVEAIQAERIAA